MKKVRMNNSFQIVSSDPALLKKALIIAREFAQQYVIDDIEGIVFLGGIARGYFDSMADIDIAIFSKKNTKVTPPPKFSKIEGIEVHCWWSEYETELIAPWEMSKRWTYSQRIIFHDPHGKIEKLLAKKVPLKPEEKKWLLMSNFTLSEWYFNRLTELWITRGNIISAHHMFHQGLIYFFNMLFIYNNQLVPDMKWLYYSAEKLQKLPDKFKERVKGILILHEINREEIDRRRKIFLEMWNEMLPIIEEEVQLTYKEMEQLV